MAVAEHPVVVIGGGIVGLCFAQLLAEAQLPVVVVESHRPTLQWDPSSLDARVSAINAASQRCLERLGVWSRLPTQSYSPLSALWVWDGISKAEITFDSAEIGAPALGAIVENRALVRALWESLQGHSCVELLCPATPQNLAPHAEGLLLTLHSGRAMVTPLIVGADGAHSWVSEHMASDRQTGHYGQSAIVAVVQTEEPHQCTGWQVFLPTGPLALLPLADKHHCAIVWSTDTAQAEHLVHQDTSVFNDAIHQAFGVRLGDIQLLDQPRAFPLIMRHAQHYVQPHQALIGDAAHTLHPLAGQGVNLGIRDAFCLAQCLIETSQVGSWRALRRYERSRKGDNTLMLWAMRGFKELFGSTSPWVVQSRSLGLTLTDRWQPLKNGLMHVAMGEWCL